MALGRVGSSFADRTSARIGRIAKQIENDRGSRIENRANGCHEWHRSGTEIAKQRDMRLCDIKTRRISLKLLS